LPAIDIVGLFVTINVLLKPGWQSGDASACRKLSLEEILSKKEQ